MDFVVGDVVRQGFGFANPNHAAAAICAMFPFCWGWGGAHTSSDRLRGALRSGDTSARVLPSLRKSKVIARLLKGWFGIFLARWCRKILAISTAMASYGIKLMKGT